jgi:hypothetical protein
MSALKQNPFVVGFGVVMVLGVGALGYLTYTAADEHSAAQTAFEEAENDLKRLQGLRPYPEQANLTKFLEQKKELQAKVDALQRDLAAQKFKLEPIEPTAFQDKLRETVARVASRAADGKVVLPGGKADQKFYLGFNTYQSEPPKTAAAAPLYRQLKAIEDVMNIVIDVGNTEVRELTRELLPEEKDVKPAPVEPKKGNKKGAAEDTGRKVVDRAPFTVELLTTQENFSRILNAIVANKDQLFVARNVVILNEKQDAPGKVAPAQVPPPTLNEASEQGTPAAPTPAADPNATPGATPGAPAPGAPAAEKLEYVFGKERVRATLELELVDVADVAPPTEANTAAKKND